MVKKKTEFRMNQAQQQFYYEVAKEIAKKLPSDDNLIKPDHGNLN